MGAHDRSIHAHDPEWIAAVQVPARIYLPRVDDACQLDDELPAWRATRARADDIEYVRSDLAASQAATQAASSVPGERPSPEGDEAARSGQSIVARWCRQWGDERPSRAVQRTMAEDIDRAIATALESQAAARSAPRRRSGAARPTRAVEQLALELTALAPSAATAAREPESGGPSGEDASAPGRRVDPPVQSASVAGSDAHRWVRFDAYVARLWSSANVEALARLAVRPGGLDVALHAEPTNEVDGEAVALSVDLPEAQAGGFAAAWAPQRRVIGYVARAEARKAALFAVLSAAGEPRHVRLHLEPDGWYVHVVRAARA